VRTQVTRDLFAIAQFLFKLVKCDGHETDSCIQRSVYCLVSADIHPGCKSLGLCKLSFFTARLLYRVTYRVLERPTNTMRYDTIRKNDIVSEMLHFHFLGAYSKLNRGQAQAE